MSCFEEEEKEEERRIHPTSRSRLGNNQAGDRNAIMAGQESGTRRQMDGREEGGREARRRATRSEGHPTADNIR